MSHGTQAYWYQRNRMNAMPYSCSTKTEAHIYIILWDVALHIHDKWRLRVYHFVPSRYLQLRRDPLRRDPLCRDLLCRCHHSTVTARVRAGLATMDREEAILGDRLRLSSG